MTERAWITLIICTAVVLLFLIEKVAEYNKERVRKERWERWSRRRELDEAAEDDLGAFEVPAGSDVIQIPGFLQQEGRAADGA